MAEELSSFDKTIYQLAAEHMLITGTSPEDRAEEDRIAFRLVNLARQEYIDRGLVGIDLRKSDHRQIQERAGLLAMMTVPPSPEAFSERAAMIEEFLARVISGGRIKIEAHSGYPFNHPEQDVTVDTSRPLYTVIGYDPRSRKLPIWYDSSRYSFYSNDPSANAMPPQALVLDLLGMVQYGVVSYPKAA